MTPYQIAAKSAIAALLAVGLAACSNSDANVADPNATLGAAGAGAGAGGVGQYDPSSVEYFKTTVGDVVYFDTDSSALSFEAQETLRRQAAWLADNPSMTAVIEGHADERGTRDYNLALGARRASAARSFLIGEGVAANRLTAVTYGKERPVALCSNESCWSRNRRAVTVVAGAPLG